MNSHEKNDNENQNPEQSIVETTIDPWQVLQTGFKGIRLLKNPTRIKEIRDLANLQKVDYNEQITKLDSQLQQMSDPLDKLSAQQRITELKQKISAIDKNLAGINSRVEELVEEYSNS
jgi:predicted  nucleic acid-binding Zn-ribbon protein